MDRRRGQKIAGVAASFDRIFRCAVDPALNDDLPRLGGLGVADQFRRVLEFVHEPHRHGDVGPAGLGAVEIHADFVPGVRRDLQQRGKKLR